VSSIWVDLLGSQVHYVGTKYRTRVIEAGEGEALVLMHGGGGHAEAYARNLMRLGQRYRAMAIDFVWHGLTSKPPYDGTTIPTYTTQFIDLLDTLGIERAHLEGESVGGWVGLWLAVHHPDRLGKLILNTTAGVKLDPVRYPPRPGGRDLMLSRSVEAINDPTPERIRKRLEWLMASPDRVTDELVDVRRTIYSEPRTKEVLSALFPDAFSTPGKVEYMLSPEQLKTIKAPTLVLWSDHNPGVGPDVGEYIASLIPGAQFYCMADASHWPQWEHPEEHDDVVLRFLAGDRVDGR
jgi:pimeloyl-ACP methyl ester carboxylesterase